MKFFKLATLAALASAALSASAFTAIDDSALSQVSGQDGVSIAADLHINIGSFTYKDTDATGGSVSFNNIQVDGFLVNTIDILNNATALNTIATSATAYATSLADAGQIVADLTAWSGKPAGDVVQIAFPVITSSHSAAPDITVGSITMGGSTASFGSFAIKDLDLQGTKVWMWAH